MSASIDATNAAIDVLQAKLETEARKNGRLELANEVLQWWIAHKEEFPPHLREGFAQLLLRVCL